MKNKQHDVTKEIKDFMTLISRNFVYEKSMSIQNVGSKVLSSEINLEFFCVNYLEILNIYLYI